MRTIKPKRKRHFRRASEVQAEIEAAKYRREKIDRRQRVANRTEKANQ